jgi:hypothetical protein
MEDIDFDELYKRYRAFERYEKEKFATDTPENQEIAIRGFKRLTTQLSEIWDRMQNRKTEVH